MSTLVSGVFQFPKNYLLSPMNSNDLPDGLARRSSLLGDDTGDDMVTFTPIRELLRLQPNIHRSGVIVYSYDETTKKTYFYMGIDSKSGDITDFGGGVRSHENFVNAGLRELHEESGGIFNKNINSRNVSNFYVASSKRMSIMFIRIDVDYSLLKQSFIATKELADIIRLDPAEFVQMVFSDNNNYNNYKVYHIVKSFLKNFLQHNTNFMKLI